MSSAEASSGPATAPTSAEAVLATTNGRYNALADGLQPAQLRELVQLAERQKAVGAKAVPVLAIYGIDLADEAQLDTLADVLAYFLTAVRPAKLMLSGRRTVAIADKAELVLRRVLAAPESFKPSTLVSGGADGVDSVALRLVAPPVCPGLTVTGQYTPTPFARADVECKINPNPIVLTGLQPGPSPLRPAAAMEPVPAPGPGAEFAEFISLMEAQWEARDTYNAELADAVVCFLTNEARPQHGHHRRAGTLVQRSAHSHRRSGTLDQRSAQSSARLTRVQAPRGGQMARRRRSTSLLRAATPTAAAPASGRPTARPRAS